MAISKRINLRSPVDCFSFYNGEDEVAGTVSNLRCGCAEGRFWRVNCHALFRDRVAAVVSERVLRSGVYVAEIPSIF